MARFTTYADQEESGRWNWNHIGLICPTLATWARFLDDPTYVEDAAGGREYYAYNAFRQRIGVIDKTGRVTAANNWSDPVPGEERSWMSNATAEELDNALGLGELWKHFAFALAPAPSQRTLFAYERADFPGVVTTHTVKWLDPAVPWGQDLVTVRELDDMGRVRKETVGEQVLGEFTYDLNGNRSSVTDARGYRTSFIYDSRNRLVRTYFPTPEGFELHYRQFEYDAAGNKVSARDENGNTSWFYYDARNRLWLENRPSSGTTYHTYDVLNSEVETRDPRGTITKRTYDPLRRLQTVTEAFGQPEARTTTFQYPLQAGGTDAGAAAGPGNGFQVTRQVDPRGFVTRTIYDELYRPVKTSIAYGAPGQEPVIGAANVATTTTEYDEAARVTAVIDPLNKRTETSYDALGRPEVVTYADAKTTRNFYTSTGLKWKVKDEAGKFWETRYDAAGRVTEELGPDLNDGTRPLTEFAYDPAGNLEEKRIQMTAGANPAFSTWTYQYDGRNRKITEIGPPVETGRQITQWSYDAVGNLIAIQDARGKTTNYSYDAQGRLRFVTAPQVKNVEGALVRPVTETRYDANGNVLRVIDAEGRHTVNTYDRLNRLKTTTQQADSNASSAIATVTYGYDACDNRVSVKDGKNQETTFTYDGLKRVLTDQPPTGPPRVHVYNARNRTHYDDGSGIFDAFFYDDRHRLETMLPKSNAYRGFTYDAKGRIDQVYEEYYTAANVTYQYDPAGRLASETSSDATHYYEYDLAGNRVLTRYGAPDGSIKRIIVSEYDAAGRLKGMREWEPGEAPGTARETSYFYDGNGNVTRKTLPNGVVEQATFDALNRHRFQTIKDGAAILTTHEQFYDRTGNVRVIVEQVEGESLKNRRLELEYDGASRLVWEKTRKASGTQWTDDGAVRYEYDAANNRTWKRRYAAGEPLPPAGQVGNPAESWQSTYNVLNQLTHYEHLVGQGSGSLAEYDYDVAGNRIERIRGDEKISYYYDLDMRLCGVQRTKGYGTITDKIIWRSYDYRGRQNWREEYYGDGNWQSTRVSFSGGTSVSEYDGSNLSQPAAEFIRGSDWGGGVGGLLYSLRPGLGVPEPRYTHYNGRGDVVLQTDQAKQKTYEAAYEAFGTRTRESGSTPDRQRANTKEEETEFGLLNEGFRYRDLETGVWLTRDPAGFVDGPNLYAYVRQNPWSMFDPHGLEAVTPEQAAALHAHRRKYIENDYNSRSWGTKRFSDVFGVHNQMHKANDKLYENALSTGDWELSAADQALLISEQAVRQATITAAAVTAAGAAADALTAPGEPDGQKPNSPNDKPNGGTAAPGTYRPDRTLPRDDRTREPVLDPKQPDEVGPRGPHTQLGKREGEDGREYTQAREFDEKGKPVKDIDFTDHGRPKKHPNPHQHRWLPNPTGGSMKRSKKAEPLNPGS